MGRITRYLKAGLVTGALVGALAGSAYRNVNHAYESVLKSLGSEVQAKTETLNSLKKDLSPEVYNSQKEQYENIRRDIQERLSTYKKSSDADKKKMALSDLKNWRKTGKNLKVLPQKFSDLDPRGPVGKGAGYGMGIGAISALGLAARRRKTNIRNRLERR